MPSAATSLGAYRCASCATRATRQHWHSAGVTSAGRRRGGLLCQRRAMRLARVTQERLAAIGPHDRGVVQRYAEHVPVPGPNQGLVAARVPEEPAVRLDTEAGLPCHAIAVAKLVCHWSSSLDSFERAAGVLPDRLVTLLTTATDSKTR